MPTELFLMRHGETEYNAAKILQGWCDSPLTEQGRRDARAVGGKLASAGVRFDAAFCSTLPRTAATAEIVLDALKQNTLPLTRLDGLREYGFGSFEGGGQVALYETLAAAHGMGREDWLAAYRACGTHNMLIAAVNRLDSSGKAETEAAFNARLHDALHRIVASVPEGSRVLVVSHGMAITAILRGIDPAAIARKSPPNVSVSRVRFDAAKGFLIESVAEARFLVQAA